MRKDWMTFLFAITLLCGGAFADFIQSPIPPSSKQNYFRDIDGDGRMDHIEIRFLGTLTPEYLSAMIDSLVFDWLDTSGIRRRYVVPGNQMEIDSANSRLVHVNLEQRQKGFLMLTSRSRMDYAGTAYGNAHLYVADTVEYDVNIRDGMAPTISFAHLKSYRGKGTDSLSLIFTENVDLIEGCNAFLEFKSEDDEVARVLPTSAVHWNYWMTEAVVELPDNLLEAERISTRDSIRLLNGCARDTVKNMVTGALKFFPVQGFYPFDAKYPVLAVDRQQIKNQPVFQVEFADAAEQVEDSVWRVSLDVAGPEFENALKDALGMSEKATVDMSKLVVRFNVKIYTNLGSYVVGTKATVKGNDPRMKYSPTRLSLRWNMMDGKRRRVATGAYLMSILLSIEYDGKVVYRNDQVVNETSHTFGVMRR